jgi:hypothetical protein
VIKRRIQVVDNKELRTIEIKQTDNPDVKAE